MPNKASSWLAVLALIVFLVNTTDAVRLGVVVEFPDGDVFKKCLTVDGNSNGYYVMEKTGLDNTWSAPGPFGHGLCAINAVGCPASNCFCNPDEFWNFYTKGSGEDSWTYSGVGFDGGETCSEHYCAKEGDLLGFAYGVYGTEPVNISFEDVCPPLRRRSERFDVSISPKELFAGDSITIELTDVSTGKGIKGVEVEVLNGDKVSGETDGMGEISFKLVKPGVYKLRVNAKGYNPPQRYLEITVEPAVLETTTSTTSTSSTTTSTTSSTTTSTTSTTTSSTTSTTSTTTTSTSSTSTSTTYVSGLTGMVVESPVAASFLVFISVILVLAAYLGYISYRRYEKKRKAE